MKLLILIALVASLSGCVIKHDYDNTLHCHKGVAYLIEPRVGDLVYLRPTPIANELCKESK